MAGVCLEEAERNAVSVNRAVGGKRAPSGPSALFSFAFFNGTFPNSSSKDYSSSTSSVPDAAPADCISLSKPLSKKGPQNGVLLSVERDVLLGDFSKGFGAFMGYDFIGDELCMGYDIKDEVVAFQG